MFEVVFLTIVALIAYIILKSIDFIFYRKAFFAKKEIKKALKKRNIRLYDNGKYFTYHKKYEKYLKMISKVINYNANIFPPSVKMKTILCFKKYNCNIKRLPSIMYVHNNNYCPKIYELYFKIELLYKNGVKRSSKIENSFFDTNIESEDMAIEYILDLSLEEFLKKCFYLENPPSLSSSST